MNKNRIRVLAVDLDDIILDFRANAAWSIERAFREWNLDYSQEVLETFLKINEGFWQRIEKGELSFEELRKIRWNTVFSALEIKGIDGEVFEDSFRKYLNESHILMPDADTALRKLSENYELMIISNGAGYTQKSRIQKAGIEDVFFDILSSEEAGFKKPDPRFFRFMHQRIENHIGTSDIDEILVIGDSVTADIQGACLCGYPCIWLNPVNARSSKQRSAYEPDFKASSWIQILSFLNSG